MKKFTDYIKEDITIYGNAFPSKVNVFSNDIQTGYDLQPVMGKIEECASAAANEAKRFEESDNEKEKGEEYINQVLESCKGKIHETYQGLMEDNNNPGIHHDGRGEGMGINLNRRIQEAKSKVISEKELDKTIAALNDKNSLDKRDWEIIEDCVKFMKNNINFFKYFNI